MEASETSLGKQVALRSDYVGLFTKFFATRGIQIREVEALETLLGKLVARRSYYKGRRVRVDHHKSALAARRRRTALQTSFVQSVLEQQKRMRMEKIRCLRERVLELRWERDQEASTRSQQELAKFPQPHRPLIKKKDAIQDTFRRLARAGLLSLNKRLIRKHILKLSSSSGEAAREDCDTPGVELDEAWKLLRDAENREDIQSSVQPIEIGRIEEPVDTKLPVFISHAGEDKATIAIPLRDMLRKNGIAAFVDDKDLAPGGDAKQEMITAMETAHVAIVVLSPEFVSREWPIKELLCFLRRREEARVRGASYPIVIPLFYRLNISDLYLEPRLDRKKDDGTSLYKSSRFFERRDRGDPEADIPTIQSALRKLHGITGVRNDLAATNASDYVMYTRRESLLKLTCDKAIHALSGQSDEVHDEGITTNANQVSSRAGRRGPIGERGCGNSELRTSLLPRQGRH